MSIELLVEKVGVEASLVGFTATVSREKKVSLLANL